MGRVCGVYNEIIIFFTVHHTHQPHYFISKPTRTMYQDPSTAINVQRQSNQFLLPSQYESEIDAIDVYPSVSAASNESIASLNAMMGQSAPNMPSRMNNDPLSQELRADRPSLATMRAVSAQNPFNVRGRDEEVSGEVLFKGGNVDKLMRSLDMPDTSNSQMQVSTGIEAQSRPLFSGGDNQVRSAVKKRKRAEMVATNIPPVVEYRRFGV